ncbi:MAG: hypothetical protein ACREKS_10810 [Candidatus Rokuibacteriota bacterium]
MTNGGWNPWKVTTIGLLISIGVALVGGLVVANWTGPKAETGEVVIQAQKAAPTQGSPAPAKAAPVARAAAPRPVAATPTVPSQTVVEACNQQAAKQVGPHDKTMEVVKDGVIGAVAGAAVGAAGGAIAGGGKGAGTGAAIGGLVGAGGGTLYGLNENRRYDERYRDAYATCMRARGYTG